MSPGASSGIRSALQTKKACVASVHRGVVCAPLEQRFPMRVELGDELCWRGHCWLWLPLFSRYAARFTDSSAFNLRNRWC